jgi:hypothetical protein
MKYGLLTVKILFLLFLAINNAHGQYQYSIDIKDKSSRHLPIGIKLSQMHETMKQNSEIRQKHQVERKTSRKIRRHTYGIQTDKVKKRMKKSRKKAKKNNGEKNVLGVLYDKMF